MLVQYNSLLFVIAITVTKIYKSAGQFCTEYLFHEFAIWNFVHKDIQMYLTIRDMGSEVAKRYALALLKFEIIYYNFDTHF